MSSSSSSSSSSGYYCCNTRGSRYYKRLYNPHRNIFGAILEAFSYLESCSSFSSSSYSSSWHPVCCYKCRKRWHSS